MEPPLDVLVAVLLPLDPLLAVVPATATELVEVVELELVEGVAVTVEVEDVPVSPVLVVAEAPPTHVPLMSQIPEQHSVLFVHANTEQPVVPPDEVVLVVVAPIPTEVDELVLVVVAPNPTEVDVVLVAVAPTPTEVDEVVLVVGAPNPTEVDVVLDPEEGAVPPVVAALVEVAMLAVAVE